LPWPDPNNFFKRPSNHASSIGDKYDFIKTQE
jgi:hypothetical protein